ncbi:16S rRNA (guanine(966)-N(2))-methyltransferase RsmD [Faecalimonas sp.]
MRVIGGSAKRLQLKTLEGLETRPTTDRIKETLFNMITPYLCDCMFLDLFSGSGGIGIEALSRGAKEVTFVENNPKAMQCIRANLKFTKLDKNAITMQTDAMTALRKMEGTTQFDYIFMDPPYAKGLEKQVLEYLAESDLVNEGTVIIVEAAKETEFTYLEQFGFYVSKIKEYKTNKHLFIERERGEEVC